MVTKKEKVILNIEILLNDIEEDLKKFGVKSKNLEPDLLSNSVHRAEASILFVRKNLKQRELGFVFGNVEELGKFIDMIDDSPLSAGHFALFNEMKKTHSKLVEKVNELIVLAKKSK